VTKKGAQEPDEPRSGHLYFYFDEILRGNLIDIIGELWHKLTESQQFFPSKHHVPVEVMYGGIDQRSCTHF